MPGEKEPRDLNILLGIKCHIVFGVPRNHYIHFILNVIFKSKFIIPLFWIQIVNSFEDDDGCLCLYSLHEKYNINVMSVCFLYKLSL